MSTVSILSNTFFELNRTNFIILSETWTAHQIHKLFAHFAWQARIRCIYLFICVFCFFIFSCSLSVFISFFHIYIFLWLYSMRLWRHNKRTGTKRIESNRNQTLFIVITIRSYFFSFVMLFVDLLFQFYFFFFNWFVGGVASVVLLVWFVHNFGT